MSQLVKVNHVDIKKSLYHQTDTWTTFNLDVHISSPKFLVSSEVCTIYYP